MNDYSGWPKYAFKPVTLKKYTKIQKMLGDHIMNGTNIPSGKRSNDG